MTCCVHGIAPCSYYHGVYCVCSWQFTLVVLLLVALAHILHAQIATCTVMVMHRGGSGVMEAVPWDGSMWWLYILILGHVTI